jgi:predicted nucleic acid-binding protein
VPLIYLDSSVLIAYLYEERDQPAKYQQARRLVNAIRRGSTSAIISFYALPELYSYVSHHQLETEISKVLRLSLVELFSLPIIITPFLNRSELNRLLRQVRITDSDDARHVAVAMSRHCSGIITYDRHFREIANLIPVFTPDEYLATLEASESASSLE